MAGTTTVRLEVILHLHGEAGVDCRGASSARRRRSARGDALRWQPHSERERQHVQRDVSRAATPPHQNLYSAPIARGGSPMLVSPGTGGSSLNVTEAAFHTCSALACASARKHRSVQPGAQRTSPSANAAPASSSISGVPTEVSSVKATSERCAVESPKATLTSSVSLANVMVEPIGAPSLAAASNCWSTTGGCYRRVEQHDRAPQHRGRILCGIQVARDAGAGERHELARGRAAMPPQLATPGKSSDQVTASVVLSTPSRRASPAVLKSASKRCKDTQTSLPTSSRWSARGKNAPSGAVASSTRPVTWLACGSMINRSPPASKGSLSRVRVRLVARHVGLVRRDFQIVVRVRGEAGADGELSNHRAGRRLDPGQAPSLGSDRSTPFCRTRARLNGNTTSPESAVVSPGGAEPLEITDADRTIPVGDSAPMFVDV